eukprot:jgi/Antlo1/1706/1566
MGLALGDRVQLGTRYSGTVEYIGNLAGKEGIWVGLRLDDPLGTNDGTYNGMRYFYAKDRYGLFAKYTRLEKMQLDAHLLINKASEMNRHHKPGAVESFEVSYADRNAEHSSDVVEVRSHDSEDASHKVANSNAIVNDGFSLQEKNREDEAYGLETGNIFVRYDSNYINKLKDKIQKLRHALKEEREQKAEIVSYKKQKHPENRGERMAALSKDVGTKIRSIKNDIDALDTLIRDLKDKIRVPKDRSDLSSLVESILHSIVKEDVDELNKNLKAYEKKIKAHGIKFEI